MKLLKKILKITGISFLVLILLAFTIPIIFKKQVQAIVKKEINKQFKRWGVILWILHDIDGYWCD